MTIAGIYSDKILNSDNSRNLGLDAESRLLVPHGLIENKASIVTLFDDFLGTTLSTRFNGRVGSDSGNVVTAAVSAATSGMVRMVTGASGTTTMAVNGAQLESQLNWVASNGYLTFEAKVKIDVITSVAYYVGFTDQASALEMPFTLSSGSLTSNASDACGFLFDTAATAATIKLVGVAADTDATVQDTALAYVAATYRTLRIELNTSGSASFFIDGVMVGSAMTGAVTAATALTPVIAGFSRSAAIRNLDCDYIYTYQKR